MAKYLSTCQGLRALSRAQENSRSEPTYQQLCSGCSAGLSAAPSVLEDVWATCLWQHPDSKPQAELNITSQEGIFPSGDDENEIIQISDSDSESDFSNDEIHRRKKRKKRRKKKKLFPSQLIRLIARLRRIDPELA